MLVRRADVVGLRFVGGHPMAGRETAGYAAGDGRPVRRPAVGRRPGRPPRRPPTSTGSSTRPGLPARLAVVLDAATHDVAVAGISHLPLVVAAALVEAVVGVGGVATGLARRGRGLRRAAGAT